MNLKDEIRKIIQLQEIDLRIYHLRQELDTEKPEQLRKIKETFEQKKQGADEAEKKLKALQLRKKETELDLASKEENLRKYQGQLYQLKTNKEYQLKLTEISSLKADVSVAEENVLKILEETEFGKTELDRQKGLLKEEEENFKKEENVIREQIKDNQALLKNLEDKRSIAIKDVNKEILDKYERLLKTRNGLAIVPIKDNNCGACHLTVTHQEINQIKMYEELVYCNNCVRILYIPDDIGEC